MKERKARRKEINHGILEITNSPTCLTLFNNDVTLLSVAPLNQGKLHTLVSMVTLPIMLIVVKQRIQLWDLLLHSYELNSHKRMVWFP
jgi:hypothetical protein